MNNNLNNMYQQAILNRYADMNEKNAQMSEQQNQRYSELYDKLKNRKQYQKMDLSPLASLVDSETGSNFAQSYQKPVDDIQAEQMYGKNTGDIQNRNNATMDRYGTLLNYFGKKSPADQLALHKAKKEIDQQYKDQKPETFTQDQSKAATFAQRMSSSVNDLENLLNTDGYDPTDNWNAFARKWGPDWTKDDDHKAYEQAQRNFITAQLRRESGAAISPSEFEEANKNYFPQAGDGPDVLAQKARARRDAIEGMKSEAGGAYDKLRSRIDGGGMIDKSSQQKPANDPRVEQFMQRNGINDPNEAIRILKENGIMS